MQWWRVELDETGAIRQLEAVDAPSRNGRLVAYVQGETRVEAARNVFDWYKRYRAQQLASAQRRKERLRAEGLCTLRLKGCQHKPEGGHIVRGTWQAFKTCQNCRDRKNAAERLLVTRKRTTPEAARAAYLRTHCRTLHARTVLRQFDALGPAAFRAWLVRFIEDGQLRTAKRIKDDPLLAAAKATKRGAAARRSTPHVQH